MQASKDKVVSFDYTVTDIEGTVIDTSHGGTPMTYLHGARTIIPGLEAALEGRSVGDVFAVAIAPADAYGPHDPELVQAVDRDHFPADAPIHPGSKFNAETPDGPRTVVVVNVSDSSVTIDANHPLAGKQLNFDVKILGIRNATPEELQHGHVHGPGGHSH